MPIVSYEQLAARHLDYIIVGGGTAGLALAARLSEEPDLVVAVLEAGEHHAPAPEVDIPGYVARTLGNPKYDWNFSCIPQPGADNREIPQPRGKGLGGSSLINFLGMFRPSKAEVDALEELGAEGWGWDSLLYYLKKSEGLQRRELSVNDAIRFAADPDPAFHGQHGPVKTSFGAHFTELHAAFYDTLQALGVPRNPDTGNGRNNGAMTSLLSIDARTATRSHAASAYLEPNLHRENLLVLTGAHVTKVLLKEDGDLQKAIGVEFIHANIVRTLTTVRREIILAAGSYQTPQLLELSGIGSSEILPSYGITVKVDLPGVGENLQDHIGLPTMVEIETDEPTTDDLADPAFAAVQAELYKSKQGMYAAVPAQAFAFLSADALGGADDIAQWRAEADAASAAALAGTHPALRRGLEKQYAVHRRLFAAREEPQAELLMYNGRARMPAAPPPQREKRYMSLVCALSRPLSRGRVHIASADPRAPPRIDPAYFAHPADRTLLRRVLEHALRVYATPPLARVVRAPVMPSAAVLARGRVSLEAYIRENCRQVFHPVGTAAMRPRADGGVVDSSLRVYGTRGLRVVDLSVLPMELVCHTQSVAYAIGEKAADIIKAELGRGHVH